MFLRGAVIVLFLSKGDIFIGNKNIVDYEFCIFYVHYLYVFVQ